MMTSQNNGKQVINMDRQYENPRELEKRLEEAKAKLVKIKADVDNGKLDFDVLVDAQLNVDELSDRVNFAWQDEEFEEDYARENGNVYHANPLDDEWDDDVDDYTFDIPSNAF